MHPKDDLLRALVDQELSENKPIKCNEHLRRCRGVRKPVYRN